MRFLGNDEMVCLLPASVDSAAKANEQFSTLLTQCDNRDTNRLTELTNSGFLQTAEVRIGGRPASVIWYRVERERLIVDTLVSVNGGQNCLEESLLAYKQIAHAHNCNSVEGVTARRGLANAYIERGAVAVGVAFRFYLA